MKIMKGDVLTFAFIFVRRVVLLILMQDNEKVFHRTINVIFYNVAHYTSIHLGSKSHASFFILRTFCTYFQGLSRKVHSNQKYNAFIYFLLFMLDDISNLPNAFQERRTLVQYKL